MPIKDPWHRVREQSRQRDGTGILQSLPPLRLPVAQLALFRRRQDRAHPLHGEVRRAVAAHHDVHAQHHPYRRAGPCRRGHALHRRGSAAALLRLRHRRLDSEGHVGADHLRGSREGRRQSRAAERHRHRQHRLASQVSRQRGIFLQMPRLRAVGRSTGSSRRRSRSSATTRRPTIIRSRPRSARIATVRCIPTSPRNTRNGPAGATGRRTSPSGSPSIAFCSRTASSASKTSAAISTR